MLARRVPKVVAIVVSLVATIAIVTGHVWLVIWQVSERNRMVDLADRAMIAGPSCRWVLTVGILPDEVVNDMASCPTSSASRAICC